MNKKIPVFFLVIVAALSIFTGCRKKAAQAEPEKNSFQAAQKVYNEQGFDAFTDYVSEYRYFGVRDKNENEATPLLLAIKYKALWHYQLFRQKGASLSEKDKDGLDALDYALKNFDQDIMEELIADMPHTDWEVKDSNHMLPCAKIISKCSNYDIIANAITRISIADQIDYQRKTLLMYAAQLNTDVRVVKLLLDQQADINAKNTNEWSAVMYAARYNPNPLVLEHLLLRGANISPNSAGLTLTMLAACNPNKAVLMTLLTHIHEVNAYTDKGKTALMYACENKAEPAIIQLLLDKKADVNLRDENGKTSLMYALEAYPTDTVPTLLITAGADRTASDNEGKTVKEYLDSNDTLSKKKKLYQLI